MKLATHEEYKREIREIIFGMPTKEFNVTMYM